MSKPKLQNFTDLAKQWKKTTIDKLDKVPRVTISSSTASLANKQDDNIDCFWFQQAVKGVQPLAKSGELVDLSKRKVKTKLAIKHKAIETVLPSLSISDDLDLGYYLSELNGVPYFTRQASDINLIRKLREGFWAVQDTLDLHQLTIEQARSKFVRWIINCQKRNLRCVLVIHGKGWQPEKAVLNKAVYSWSIQLNNILAISQSPQHLGGNGAALLMLRKKPS